MYITEDRRKAIRVVREVLSPTLNRTEGLSIERLLVGPANECAEKLLAFKEAEAQRMFLWPVVDELPQMVLFMGKVATLLSRFRFF